VGRFNRQGSVPAGNGAEPFRGGHSPPLRWPQSRHPATLLIDQDRSIGSPDGVSEIIHQPAYLVGCCAIPLKQDEPNRIRRTKEIKFI
jgi:hypothetical protein